MAFETNSPFDLTNMVVNTKAATVYAAHESSLFLSGEIVPVSNIPAGSNILQVPVLDGGSTTTINATTALAGEQDIPVSLVTDDNSVNITADIYAARTVLRDLGGIDPVDLGRQLGNKVSASWDAAVAAVLETAGIQDEAVTLASMSLTDIFNAVAAVRAGGESGQLYGVLGTTMAASLMGVAMAGNNVAGSQYGAEALRQGFVGQIGGVNMFQSSAMTATKGCIFSKDAFRIGMYKNVDLEIARRTASVGNDIVASLHAGVGMVDASRAVTLIGS